MNSRSELRPSYDVSSSISIHLSCHSLIVIACCVFTIPPPLFSGRPRCYRRLHRCRVRLRRRRPYPYCRATRQAAIPLSHISPICLYLSVALGITAATLILFNCIACHCRPLQYFPYPMQPDIYILYSSEPCALLAIGLDSGPCSLWE